MTLLASAWPSVAIEIAPGRVTGALVRAGTGRPSLRAYATEPLRDGAVHPRLNGSNVADPAAVSEAVTSVLRSLGGRHSQVGLVIPDLAAKVSLVRFDTVPARDQDLSELIGWQVRKSAPFRIEDAQMSYTPGAPRSGGGREFVVVLARRDVVQEYEAACTGAGVRAGVVDLATFNLVNLVLASARGDGSGDWLLVHVETDYSTVAIVRGESLVFYRSAPADGESNLADFVHQTTMYYEDRLGGAGFERVILAGGGRDADTNGDLQQTLADRVGQAVEVIAPGDAATIKSRQGADPAALAALASPLGLLVRRRPR